MLPRTADAVAARARRSRGTAGVRARGSGTGLAGGATPLDGPVVIVTTRMDRVLEVDAEHRVAWVEPGVLNLDLTRAVRPPRLHYAPDPSSQQACTIGGNVATNAGGPHCLAAGVTAAHVLAVEVVLPTARSAVLGGLEPDHAGLRPAGQVRRERGHHGHRHPDRVRLMPDPPAIRTMLADFDRVEDAAATVAASSPPGWCRPRWR